MDPIGVTNAIWIVSAVIAFIGLLSLFTREWIFAGVSLTTAFVAAVFGSVSFMGLLAGAMAHDARPDYAMFYAGRVIAILSLSAWLSYAVKRMFREQR